MLAWGVLMGLAIGAYVGYLIGRAQGWRQAEADAERHTRIEPPSRTPGQPTGDLSSPSRSVRSRYRDHRFLGGDADLTS